jgi:hypothetical protein
VSEDARDQQVYEDIGAAVTDWREGRLGWPGLLERVEQAASRLSGADQPQREELLWRLERLRGLGAPAADGRAPEAPTRLIERELNQITKMGPDWQPPPPRPRRARSAQWLSFAGLLAAYGGVDVFFGKTSLAALAFAFAAIFAGLAFRARVQERRPRRPVQATQAVQALRAVPPEALRAVPPEAVRAVPAATPDPAPASPREADHRT